MNKLGAMVVLGLLIVSVALIPGCVERLGKPEVREISHSWGSVTHDTAEISTNVVVYNPNPVSIPFKKITFDLYMNELRMATGSTEEDLKIKAGQETIILLTSYFDNGKIPDWWVSHLKKGEESDVKIEGGVVFDLGALGEFRFPFERTQTIETDILEKLNLEEDRTYGVGPVSLTMRSLSSSWGKVIMDSSEINHKAVIHNPNPFPIPVSRIDHETKMNDVLVGRGTTHDPVILEASGDTIIPFTTEIDNKMLDEWWVTHIQNNEKTVFLTEIQLVVEVRDMEYRFTLIREEKEFKTNLLGNG